jgi:tetratricopeptide (TPR) repeat protein
MAERYTYVPALGIAFCVALGLAALERDIRRRRLRNLAAGAVALWIFLQVAIIRARVPDWRDDRTLWVSALSVDPRSWYALFEMGHADAREDNWESAARWYRLALEVNASDSRLLSNASAAFMRVGDLDGALRYGHDATLARGANPRAHYNYAVALATAGRLDEARAELGRALALAPSYQHAKELLAKIDAPAP